MIDWLLAAQPHALGAGRWVIGCCGLAVLGLGGLPHDTAHRIIAITGLAVTAIVFALWLGMVIVTILCPRLLADLRRKRAVAPKRPPGTRR